MTPPSSSALAVPSSRALRSLVVGGQDHNRQVAGLEAEPAHHFDAERMALRRLLRADIAAADLVDRRRHRHVLVHHLDAGLGGLLARAAGSPLRPDGPSSRCRRDAPRPPRAIAASSSRWPSRRRHNRPARRYRRRPAARRCRRSCRRRRPRRRRRRSADAPCCTICRATPSASAALAAPMRVAPARRSAVDPRHARNQASLHGHSSQLNFGFTPLLCRPRSFGRR